MIAVHRNRASGWTAITLIFAGLFALAVSQALSSEPASAIVYKETPTEIVFDSETQQ